MHQAEFRISTMCYVLRVSRSGYYSWLQRGRSRWAQADRQLIPRIQQIYEGSHGRYGVHRIRAALRRSGIRVSPRRISRLMASAGIGGGVRRGRINTTRADGSVVARDLVKREFRADRPNQIWVADNLPFCKRIVLSATERGELVLRLLRKEATAGELAREAEISEPTLYLWRDAFLKGGFSNLDGRQGTDSERRRLKRELEQRDQLIGEMSVALRTLKKVWASPIDRHCASLYSVRDGSLARFIACDLGPC